MDQEIAVLVVDEDEQMLDLTETFLKRESDRIDVTTEQNAQEAAERAGEFDAVVSDLRMPAMDGLELCETIRDDDPELPFFLFTAADESDLRDDCDESLSGVIRKGTGTEHYGDLAEQILDVTG